MSRTHLLFASLAVLLFAFTAQLHAAETVHLYLKINGADIKGESTLTSLGRKDSIECVSYEQVVDVAGGASAAGGATRGRSIVHPIIIRKRIDKSSPLLLKAVQDGQVAEGLFRFYRPNPTGDGTTQQFYSVVFTNGRIISVRQFVPETINPASADEPPLEEVMIACEKVTYTFVDGGVSSDVWTGGGGETTTPPTTTTAGAGAIPGYGCVPGTTYKLGPDKTALSLTVKSAEYSPGHVKVANGTDWAARDEKLLVVHYTLGNPNTATLRVNTVSLDWTATNVNGITRLQDDVIVEGTNSGLNQDLLPAQSVDCYAIFHVPAEGAVTKLFARLHADTVSPDARYDMAGKITALPAPYANPKDLTGATLLAEVPGKIGGTYVLGGYDVQVVAVEKADTVMGVKAATGKIFQLATLEYTNWTGAALSIRPVTELRDEDGTVYTDEYGTISALAMRKVDVQAKPGEPVRVRVAYLVPAAVPMKSLTLRNGNERPVVVTPLTTRLIGAG
jgi:type VI secretion system secreted protein Hcp